MRRIFALLNGLAASFGLGMLLLSGSLESSSIIRTAPQQRSQSCTSCSTSHAEPDAAQAEPSQGQCRLPLTEMRLLGGAIVSTVDSARNCTVSALLARVVEAETVSPDCELQRQLLKLAARLGGKGDGAFTLLQDCTHPPCCPGLLGSFARDHSQATVFGVAAPTADGSPANLWRMQPAWRSEELARRREPLHRLCSAGCVTVQIAHGLQGHPLRAALTAARAAEAELSGEARAAPRGSSRRLLEWLSRSELQREQERRALSKHQEQLASRPEQQQPHEARLRASSRT